MKTNDFLFKYVGKVDVTECIDLLTVEPADSWAKHTWRQDAYSTHRSTKTIPLLWLPNYWTPSSREPMTLWKFPEFSQYDTFMEDVYCFLEPLYPDCTPVKATLTNLVAGGEIKPHTDNGFCLQIVHRLHMSIITSPAVMFTVGNEVREFQVGEVYEINNLRTHSVYNRSGNDRINLMIDLMPNEYIKNGVNYCAYDKLRFHL